MELEGTIPLPQWSERGREQLERWQESLKPLNVDIVGDFAGKELFAIHGETLLEHCIRTAEVDYDEGFQLLHAVHAVETFLSKLKAAGCNFNVVWFDDLRYLCAPTEASEAEVSKYLLTRTVVVEHFEHVSGGEKAFSFRFPSVDSKEFRHYLTYNALQFLMCSSRGAKRYANHPTTLASLSVGYRMAEAGYCVALIDRIDFKSSKVFVDLVTSPGNLDPLDKSHPEDEAIPNGHGSSAKDAVLQKLQEVGKDSAFTARQMITLHALSSILSTQSSTAAKQFSAAILAHLAILDNTPLTQRSLAKASSGLESEDSEFLAKFANASNNLLWGWSEKPFASATWDAFDLVDGRLFTYVRKGIDASSLPASILEGFTKLAGFLETLVGVDVSKDLPGNQEKKSGKSGKSNGKKGKTDLIPLLSVLSFSNPVVDQYLQQVQVKTDSSEPPMESRIFQEISHWHNARKPLDPKFVPKPPDFKARRKNQRFMADTIAYSASLTGSAGKNIDPEIIVVQDTSKDSKSKSKASAQKPAPQAKASGKQASGKQKGPAQKKEGPKSGTQKALEAAEALKAEKLKKASVAVTTYWDQRCAEFEKESSFVKRYLKAQRYFQDLSASDAMTVRAEVSLYLCHVLTAMQDSRKVKISVPDVLAMLWAQTVSMRNLQLTQEVALQLSVLSKALGVPFEPSSTALPRRSLPFRSAIGKAQLALPEGSNPLEFQMNHCGPYLERSFDSAPDSRVPFAPDAWQRKVLDAVDDNKSLLVIAPTSAGKTFISFYAMKKILQASNDDIIVYVAPTKALVNQIAAEVQARFTKSYHNEGQEGRSVWAIHTRDYRVNNPQKAQILVTVPHILQIMLMASSNSSKPNSWSNRIKRIIFDEVHCIGQSEDGVVWEQLLLLAPCPIIALSATVGNPLEFQSWLKQTQKMKGHELEMVVHDARYSDLRKFIYESPDSFTFKGLTPVEQLPYPGLDSGTTTESSRFLFVHPLGSMVGKSLDTLKDISLEPRDCLSLWNCLVKHQSDKYVVDPVLHPKNFTDQITKKSDVTKWEKALKKQVGAWLVDPESPFDAVREELRGESYYKIASSYGRSTDEPQSPKESVYTGSEFSLILDLRASGALPAILFNYDRVGCEITLKSLFNTLKTAEAAHKESSPAWAKKIEEYEKWKRTNEKQKFRAPKPGKGQGQEDGANSKLDLLREEASRESSSWDTYDPEAPLAEFSFADTTKISNEELERRLETLKWVNMDPVIIEALRRGLGVHHAGMNRKYRQVVEMLFRKGFLTVVVATGTLALGINMPCKTVVFTGDSVFLSALNYRQASGRAGRRGFDLLGNVVFHNIPPHRSLEIMSARLPDLRGQFPNTVTLILRLFGLLHGTKNCDFATQAVKSLLTQNQLYLGGPDAQMAIQHHLRFSIDYLRRQHLLSKTGVPLNFSGLVGHLYFTENSAFAFHALLKDGFFHKLCSGINNPAKRPRILLEMMLVLSHLFGRIPCPRYKDKQWLAEIVNRSPSKVILPDLPKDAAATLERHNQETLQIFQGYVHTYVGEYLSNVPDNALPFTKQKVEPSKTQDMSDILPSLPETVVRSPFAALSGFTDKFATVGELCNTVRAGVFLEESSIPYLRITSAETGGMPWNAYLYDFFKHGNLEALINDNGIKRGDVWFHLKDFSLVLATIVASLANFLKADSEMDDALMIDVQDAGDIKEEDAGMEEDPKQDIGAVTAGVGAMKVDQKPAATKAKSKKKVTLDSWDDESSSEEESDEDSEPDVAANSFDGKQGESLVKVHQAFTLLKTEFDEKFWKIGA